MTSYPLPTLAFTIDATGASAPAYQDILLSLQATFKGIYGSDINLDPDTQDGQLIAAFATAFNDMNNQAIALFNSFSPASAQGAGLASVVKINGLRKRSSTFSTDTITIVGTAGTIITNGLVGDNQNLNTKWALPATVTIPGGGSIDVTGTCTTPGAITAAANTLTQILTPTRGWQTANNSAMATPGQPVETDAGLRQRQAVSTSLPALTPVAALLAAIENLAGVIRATVHENKTGSTDGQGVAAHSIATIVEGGDAQTIANTIYAKKAPGCGTVGSTTETVTDPNTGLTVSISFYNLALERIVVAVSLHPLTGYVSTTGQAIQQSVVDYINSLAIGQNVNIVNLSAAATLYNGPLSSQFEITAVTAAIFPASPGSSDITIAYNQAASCQVSDVSLTLV